jgi:hypothetical protein
VEGDTDDGPESPAMRHGWRHLRCGEEGGWGVRLPGPGRRASSVAGGGIAIRQRCDRMADSGEKGSSAGRRWPRVGAGRRASAVAWCVEVVGNNFVFMAKVVGSRLVIGKQE